MEKIRKIIQKKLVLFLIQFIILSIFIIISGYSFKISFDSGITLERKFIIQFLANYIMFENVYQLFFIVLSWLIPILIPIFVFKKYKKVIIMNLTSFFFPNFFFYVFLARYSFNFYNSNLPFLLSNTIMLSSIIILISLGGTLILKKVIKTDKTLFNENLDLKKFKILYKCANCGTEFKSKPKYCYNCLNKIIEDDQIND